MLLLFAAIAERPGCGIQGD